MILHRYFARRFLMVFLAVFAIFLGIFVLLDMVEQIRKFDSDAVGFVEIVKLTLLNVPQGLYRILPLIMILATVTLFLTLADPTAITAHRPSPAPRPTPHRPAATAHHSNAPHRQRHCPAISG